MRTSIRVLALGVVAGLTASLAGCWATTSDGPVDDPYTDPYTDPTPPVGCCDAEIPDPVAGTHMTIDGAAPDAAQAAALARFSELLFAQALAAGGDNPVISPLSAIFALGMADQGARGVTAEAFEQVFGVSRDELAVIARSLLDDLQAASPTVFTAANSAWFDSDRLTVDPDFAGLVQAAFDAEIYNLDLQGGYVERQINAWISDRTRGLIQDILDEIPAAAVAYLINALYFNAQWADQFNTDFSQERSFTLASGERIQAWMMSDEEPIRRGYIDTADATGVILPYSDGRYAFVAVMAKQGGLESLTLDGTALAGWLAAGESNQVLVDVTMPKFETAYGLTLNDALIALGLGPAFEGSGVSDFSGLGTLDSGNPMGISRVIQQVNIAVGEKGTVAAAATIVEIAEAAAAPPDETIVYLTFDQPYYYAVVDLETGLPAFIGALTDPTQAPPAA